MTDGVFADDVEKCPAAGMNAHLARPVDQDRLCSVLRELTEPQEPISAG